MDHPDSFQVKSVIDVNGQKYNYFDLKKLGERLGIDLMRLPMTIRILLENLLRNEDGKAIKKEHIESLAAWSPDLSHRSEVPFIPARVLMQDFTGVPAVVDLAAMREGLARLGGDPCKINPRIPVDLVIDHSVQVDKFGTKKAFDFNGEMELARNRERYSFLKWGQNSFENFNVVPPATGICHQVNLEYLAHLVMTREQDGEMIAFPDTLVGLDSHTTMINGVGVLGWGVGGIEAEAAMLGQPYYMLTPRVVGFEITGRLPEEATATDLVLSIAQKLREKGVVEHFVEFYGEGLCHLSVPDRATIANMTPEFGATVSFLPADRETLNFFKFTGRSTSHVQLIETYLLAQDLLWSLHYPVPDFTDTLSLDLGTVGACLAGPRKPHERIPLSQVKKSFARDFKDLEEEKKNGVSIHKRWEDEGGAVAHPDKSRRRLVLRKPIDDKGVPIQRPYLSFYLEHGSVVIAAITSCTNTSNPSVLLGAGLMAQKAVEKGLMTRPWVKTSLAPGSKVVKDYLEAAGLLPYLEALRFQVVAYGCTSCIGNSGLLPSDVSDTVQETNLVVASVLSGNRNYEGRINALTRANYLASPMLVVAYALAGTVNINMETEPLGHNPNNEPVFLKDIWPTKEEINRAMESLKPDMFRSQYSNVFEGDINWRSLPVTKSERYDWDESSTYIKEPNFFQYMSAQVQDPMGIRDARVLALLGDTITTDHISPAGAIPPDSPAAKYLAEHGVEKWDFNSYGSRRGNHEIMMRGTFGNVRLKNQLAPGTEGGWTTYLPTGEVMSIFDAAMAYEKDCTPLIVIGGKEYGSGSSRDWAAKGTLLLGVRAVIAESFERIHRSNLVAMGVLPLQFKEGQGAVSLGLTGHEVYSFTGIEKGLSPGQDVLVQAKNTDGETLEFTVMARLDSDVEVEYNLHGGILPYVLRQMLS